MSARYPVLLDLAGAPCLVVGGGRVAAGKVRGLLAVDAIVTVLAPDLNPALAGDVDASRVRWDRGHYTPGWLARSDQRWSFVVAATGDSTTNATVVADASAGGTWANDATSPVGGPASLPAVHRQGPVTVAVSTGGLHPGAARWMRDVVAASISPEHVAAIELAGEVRQDSSSDRLGGRRPDWQAALDSGMLELIRTGRRAEAKERLQACLSSSSD